MFSMENQESRLISEITDLITHHMSKYTILQQEHKKYKRTM